MSLTPRKDPVPSQETGGVFQEDPSCASSKGYPGLPYANRILACRGRVEINSNLFLCDDVSRLVCAWE